jgi:hypothetical protein
MLWLKYLPEKQIRSWLQSNFCQVISNCRRNAYFQHRKKAYSSCQDSLKCGSWLIYSTSHGKSEIIFTNVQLNRLKKGIAEISVIRYKYHYIGISLFASWVIALKETWTWCSTSRPSSGRISNHSSRQWKGVIKRGIINLQLYFTSKKSSSAWLRRLPWVVWRRIWWNSARSWHMQPILDPFQCHFPQKVESHPSWLEKFHLWTYSPHSHNDLRVAPNENLVH